MKLALDRFGKERIRYSESLEDPTAPSYHRLHEATKDGLDRMVMQSTLRDVYHGIMINKFEPIRKSDSAVVDFLVQVLFFSLHIKQFTIYESFLYVEHIFAVTSKHMHKIKLYKKNFLIVVLKSFSKVQILLNFLHQIVREVSFCGLMFAL